VTGYGTVMLASASAVATLMLVAWVVSVRRRDASVVDVAWGLGFVCVAWVSFALADGAQVRQALVAVMTTVWGLRLAVYLAWRGARTGEDFRYRDMRARFGKRFPLISLVTVFGFQGLGMWTVSLPVQAAQVPDTPSALTTLDFVGVAVWAVGMFFETVGDLQLARFRADPRNHSKVFDRGLWRYSRHPNYFGEFCVWWGIYALALATGEAWWSVLGPLTMSFILFWLSGVPEMERHLRRRGEEYESYIRRTSAFFPSAPRPRETGCAGRATSSSSRS
jgi:steroid 5-alpha reductase family enzyme